MIRQNMRAPQCFAWSCCEGVRARFQGEAFATDAYYGHFHISKLLPKVFNSVDTDQSSHKKTDHFYAGNSQYWASKR